MNKVITNGFGILLLTMAMCQITTFSYFNHIIFTYITPVGDRVEPISVFVTPLAFSLIILELAGAIGLLLVSRDNAFRTALIKIGVVAMAVWFLLICTALLRSVPIGSVGFFGERMRQPMNWLAVLQSMLFVVWGWAAYMFNAQDDAI